jgi:hypothetical protein
MNVQVVEVRRTRKPGPLRAFLDVRLENLKREETLQAMVEEIVKG